MSGRSGSGLPGASPAAVCLAGCRNHARVRCRRATLGYDRPTFVRTTEVQDVRQMRLRSVLATSLAAGIAAAFGAAPAGAAVPHVVQPGETLWSIAAANNLTTRTVAAFNGLSEDSQVVLGQTVQVPTTVEGYAALVNAGLVPADPAQASAPATAPAAAAPAPDGAGAETAGTPVQATVQS